MLKVANRVIVNFEEKFPVSILKHPIAEVLNEISDVFWDMNAVSSQDDDGAFRRTVEIILYADSDGRDKRALQKINRWIAQNHVSSKTVSPDVEEKAPVNVASRIMFNVTSQGKWVGLRRKILPACSASSRAQTSCTT